MEIGDEGIIERFADAMWVERGLSANTLGAYQTDLRQLARWLEARGRHLLGARGAIV